MMKLPKDFQVKLMNSHDVSDWQSSQMHSFIYELLFRGWFVKLEVVNTKTILYWGA